MRESLGGKGNVRLRFGPAETTSKRKAHRDFYPILADALQKVLAASRPVDREVALRAAAGGFGRVE
jgi:hypothetical protein